MFRTVTTSPMRRFSTTLLRAGIQKDLRRLAAIKFAASKAPQLTKAEKEKLELARAFNKYHPKVKTERTAPSGLGRPVPVNAELNYYAPLKHKIVNGALKAELLLKCFDPKNLEMFADFALRAAYYLGLPAKGPAPMPVKRERWTVNRAPFVHAKSKENFEREHYGRLIQIFDADEKAIDTWLAYLKENSVWGVGARAKLYQQVAADATKEAEKLAGEIDVGFDKTIEELKSESATNPVAAKVLQLLQDPVFKQHLGSEDIAKVEEAVRETQTQLESALNEIKSDPQAAAAKAETAALKLKQEADAKIADAQKEFDSLKQDPKAAESKASAAVEAAQKDADVLVAQTKDQVDAVLSQLRKEAEASIAEARKSGSPDAAKIEKEIRQQLAFAEEDGDSQIAAAAQAAQEKVADAKEKLALIQSKVAALEKGDIGLSSELDQVKEGAASLKAQYGPVIEQLEKEYGPELQALKEEYGPELESLKDEVIPVIQELEKEYEGNPKVQEAVKTFVFKKLADTAGKKLVHHKKKGVKNFVEKEIKKELKKKLKAEVKKELKKKLL